jgi:fermentation-respiration switch protein FrsA (DUF1100 family)
MKSVAVVIAVFATMLLLMVVFEKNLIFFPSRYPDGWWEVEEVASGTGCLFEDVYFSTDDGVKLHGWWVRPDEGDADDPVLLFFHGNAGNLSHRADLLVSLVRRIGAEVFVVGYRGYGRSEGRPSEEGLFLDARAAWRFAIDERGVPADRLVIFGKSLGGAVAVDLASSVEPAGLIVESSFTSIPDMAAEHYPFVPRGLVRTRMDSLAKIVSIGCPKLFVHSRSDEVVPFTLGRRLFEAAAEPKSFYEVVGAGHNETYLVGGEAYFDALATFVREVVR